jgi:hypothetical protein
VRYWCGINKRADLFGPAPRSSLDEPTHELVRSLFRVSSFTVQNTLDTLNTLKNTLIYLYFTYFRNQCVLVGPESYTHTCGART